MEGSKIAEFYEGKTILITGATGFVGKLLIDKLLRICKPKALYLLIRAKKNVEPQARLNEMFKSPVFEKMKSAVPDFKDKLILVAGDMMLPGLGLADVDRKILADTIQVVFHVAATVKFDEALPIATKINVIGTKEILKLCREMSKLESAVYVSTAYSNCPRTRIEEDFYEPPISSDNLIKLTESLKDHQSTQVTPIILDNFPNTYAFTKAVAEDAVRTHGKGLPMAVFRPAIMVSTKEDPVSGWIDNLYGPTGMMVGYGAGLIRVVRFGPDCKADLVPADMTINCLLAVGYKTGVCPSGMDIPIYNFTTHKDNILKWKDFIGCCTQRGYETPSARSVWYYTLTNAKASVSFAILTFLIHILPALIVDSILVMVNKKPRALKIYKKIHKFSDVISYFSLRSWDFVNDNVNSLWSTLGKKDKELFDFDMASLNWEKFLKDSVDGIRIFMFNEKIDNIPYAKKRLFVFWILHRTVQILFFTTFFWGLWKLGSFARWMVV